MTTKAEYKYITIIELDQKDDPSKRMWFVFNRKSGDLLGEIAWYAPWRQNCFLPCRETIFSAGCFADIQDFIKSKK